jgi:phytoene dehydrogenase-like protein
VPKSVAVLGGGVAGLSAAHELSERGYDVTIYERKDMFVGKARSLSVQGGKWQVSNSGGTFPRWSRSGHELLYKSGDQIMAASYTVKGDTFVIQHDQTSRESRNHAGWRSWRSSNTF